MVLRSHTTNLEYEDASQKAEIQVVLRLLRSCQHAARQHRERIAALVRELFAHTPGAPRMRDAMPKCSL